MTKLASPELQKVTTRLANLSIHHKTMPQISYCRAQALFPASAIQSQYVKHVVAEPARLPYSFVLPRLEVYLPVGCLYTQGVFRHWHAKLRNGNTPKLGKCLH